MPVRVEDLGDLPSQPVRQGSVAHRALEFLRDHEGTAYRLVEIAEALGVDMTTLSPALTRLHRRGLVDHEKGHWYAPSEREAAKRQAMRLANRAANVKLGRENPEDWPPRRRPR